MYCYALRFPSIPVIQGIKGEYTGRFVMPVLYVQCAIPSSATFPRYYSDLLSKFFGEQLYVAYVLKDHLVRKHLIKEFTDH